MSNHSAADANKTVESPLCYPGATPDAERGQKPPLPDLPYNPYEKSALPEPPYEPYTRNPEPPYEPYKGM
jgi:hypothetical protein